MLNQDRGSDDSINSEVRQEQQTAKGTVLVVDDIRLMRLSISRVLKDAGYTVLGAETAARAFRVIQNEDVDLLIADIKMPKVSGLELVQKIRADAKNADLPVLMCTSSKRKEDLLSAVRLGVQGFLIKPISPVELLEQLDKIRHGPTRRQVGKKQDDVVQSEADEIHDVESSEANEITDI
ncbi:MAG: response regulator [Candidatus Poribacteria bacterium]|nr:response regulator [Candidatus Poribacteria bacterium]